MDFYQLRKKTKLPTGEIKYEGIQVYYSCFAERLQTEILLQVVYEMEKKNLTNLHCFPPPPDADIQNVNTPPAEASGQAGNDVCSLVGEVTGSASFSFCPAARPPRLHLFSFSLPLSLLK